MNDPTWCDYHRGYQTSVLISLQERGSTAAIGLYACAPCRSIKKLKPLVGDSGRAQAKK